MSAEGVGKVSSSAATTTMFWLALVKVGCCPLTVGCYGPLYLEHGHAMVQFNQQGLNGHSLVGEFAPSLRSPTLGVSL
jgi:hypothetical protein